MPTPRTPMPTARTLDAPVGGPLTAPSALERCVGDAEAFLAQRFGQEPNYREGPSFDDLLSLADVDALLTGAGLRRPAVRLVRDGTPLPPASWTRRVRTGSVTVDDLLDPGPRSSCTPVGPRSSCSPSTAGGRRSHGSAATWSRRSVTASRPTPTSRRTHRRAWPRTTTRTTSSCCRCTAPSTGPSAHP